MGALIVVVCGVALLAAGGRRLWQYHVIRSWPAAEGTLVEVRTGSARERIKYSDLSYVYPIAAYQYAVHGCLYRSQRLALDAKSVWVPAESADLAPWRHWKPGDTVTVYFNGARPEESVVFPAVHPRRRSHFLAMVLAGCLLVLAGIGIAVIGG